MAEKNKMNLTLELNPEEADFLMRACVFGRLHSPNAEAKFLCEQIEQKLFDAAQSFLHNYKSKGEIRDEQF